MGRVVGTLTSTTNVDHGGCGSFPSGAYTVVELTQRGWEPTTRSPQAANVTPGGLVNVVSGGRKVGSVSHSEGNLTRAEGTGMAPMVGTLGRLRISFPRGAVDIAPGGAITIGRETVQVSDIAEIVFVWAGVGALRAPTATIVTNARAKFVLPTDRGGGITAIDLRMDGVPGTRPQTYQWLAGQVERRPKELQLVYRGGK